MPKGIRNCTECGTPNASRAVKCKQCGVIFEKQAKDKKKEEALKPKSEPKIRRVSKPKFNIVHLNREDGSWFFDIFNRYKKELNSDPEKVWHDYINNKDSKCYIIGIRPYAFCRFHYLEDGAKAICELAVTPEQQKKGLALKLIEDIGKPCIVACYKDVEGFYKKCGFTWFGNVVNEKNETLEVYKWE